jgi:[acyl-carrier-protein] S-malonyltransferase
MRSCVPPDSTSMVALTPCSLPFALHLCERAAAVGECYVANINSPQQVVITGSHRGVKAAVELGKEGWNGEKVRRVVQLDVSAPFHSPLMRPIQQAMADLVTSAHSAHHRRSPLIPPRSCRAHPSPLSSSHVGTRAR